MMISAEIDMETSYEFIKEIYNNISTDQFQQVIKQLEEKEFLFQSLLTKDRLESLSDDDLQSILKKMFSTKRVMKRWSPDQFDKFRTYTFELLYGSDDFNQRFEKFCTYAGKNLKMKKAFDVACELLAFTDPTKYHLWGSYMWDTVSDTGALALVFDNRTYLQNISSLAELYGVVGEAQEKLREYSKELGLEVTGEPNKYDIPVFLAAVYTVYLFTVTRVRMTNEFTTILPTKLELLKRLLGVFSREIPA